MLKRGREWSPKIYSTVIHSHCLPQEAQQLRRLREETAHHHEEEIDEHKDSIRDLEDQIKRHKEKIRKHRRRIEEADVDTDSD